MKTIEVQLSITRDETAAKLLAKLLAPAIRQAMAQTASESKPAKEVRLRASRKAGLRGEKPTTLPSPIRRRDAQLQYRGNGHPHKVWQLSHGDPAIVLRDCHRRPDELSVEGGNAAGEFYRFQFAAVMLNHPKTVL